MATTTKQEIISVFDEAARTTKNLLKLVPWEKLSYKPHEKSYSLLELLNHIASAELFFVNGIVRNDWGAEGDEGKGMEFKSRDEMIKVFDENHKESVRLIEELPEGELLAKHVKTPFKMEGTALRMLIMSLEHTYHHRMQLFMYLKLLGLSVNTMTIYG